MKKEYSKPQSDVLDVQPQVIIAQSMKYSNEAADASSEVLTGKSRGEWGDVWNKQ